MGKRNVYIVGYDERVQEACSRTGMSKSRIAKLCGFNRKILYPHHVMMSAGYLAKFCAVTNTDANWLLGVKEV